MSPPTKEPPPRLQNRRGAQGEQPSPRILSQPADESRFCRCGSPILRREGRCYHYRHGLPVRVLARRDGGRARWVTLDELLEVVQS
jgi:hypothetical protein